MTTAPPRAADADDSPSGTRPAVLTRALAAWISTATNNLSGGRPCPAAEQAMVTWAHTTALLRHAELRRLAPVALGPGGGEPPAGTDTRTWIRRALHDLAAAHPDLRPLADPVINPMLTTDPTAADAAALLQLWRTGTGLSADLIDGPHQCRGHRLGDLYQALSTQARSGRALVQTPTFVTRLLLRCTLDKARFETPVPTMIDPACGTGHILVEALSATLSHQRHRDRLDAVAAALAAVHGVDLDGYAAAVARYRLLAQAAAVLGGHTLADIPDRLRVNITQANALLDDHPLLEAGRYDVVLANPPYITCKDPTDRSAIRAAYPEVCHGKFSLAVPFAVLVHRLARPGGWVGQLTANSFMKREFGRPLVEDYLPSVDLRWIIDTSGAYIPGHGTPTVILISRNQPPSTPTIRVVRGNRGEPCVPADPARGHVWSAIREQVFAAEAREEFDIGYGRHLAAQAVTMLAGVAATGTLPAPVTRPDLTRPQPYPALGTPSLTA
ncbi:Eco57I restriction-modification methylase domain-containing protein [Kutzneria buriramensis]|uniref:site-specific DNA-methyltransferase (adenine-specific) n=1 Tax=Kutzneria buriramensis TaxID=1045776 RepID=A0A3E0GVV0_9PSEU|nr:N-6 DNA methylase [Kutzneria buriramensis]REH30988.1 N-6 DNA methylase [Kutzneria buriramensis]